MEGQLSIGPVEIFIYTTRHPFPWLVPWDNSMLSISLTVKQVMEKQCRESFVTFKTHPFPGLSGFLFGMKARTQA